MNELLVQELNETLSRASGSRMLACQDALRVGAATLRSGAAGEITATTVICDIDTAELEIIESLVADIAEEFGLDATIRQRSSTCAVRFSCPALTEGYQRHAGPRVCAHYHRILCRSSGLHGGL